MFSKKYFIELEYIYEKKNLVESNDNDHNKMLTTEKIFDAISLTQISFKIEKIR